MSKADKMLDDLNFKIDINKKDLCFTKTNCYGDVDISIFFDLKRKQYYVENEWGYGEAVDYGLHLAITEKLKELGWLND